jgi:hypothetical protein
MGIQVYLTALLLLATLPLSAQTMPGSAPNTDEVQKPTLTLLGLSAGQSTQPNIGQTNPSPSTDEQDIVAAARARANACASGDAQTWATFVDAGFRDIEGNHTWTREQVLDECQQAGSVIPSHKIERLVSDFRFRFVGNIALVDYLYEYKESFGEVTLNETFRQVDSFEKRQGKWVVLLSATVKVIPDPPVAKVDSTSFDDFAGEYAWVGSQNVDTVTRQGHKLYIQTTHEDSPTELLPENANTFFTRGGGVGPESRVTFVRDKTGRVIEERVYSPADGRGFYAKKIK